MRAAIDEACISLKEGNHGFGAVVARDGIIIARSYDTDESEKDPTAHAELKAIRQASSQIGKDLSSCLLVSTHEPCPMCAGAIVWSKLPFVAYGYGISEAMRQGRSRINMECTEIFRRAQAHIQVESGLLQAECTILYDRDVRDEVKKLRGASNDQLFAFNNASMKKRLDWFREEKLDSKVKGTDPLDRAYRLLLIKLGIQEDQAPISRKNEKEIVFHSMNRCPTLEACKLLGLDTRKVCQLYNEGSTCELIKQMDSRIEFTRNYEKLRPYCEYCEEIIRYANH